MSGWKTVDWEDGTLKIIDQTKLPHELSYIFCKSPDEAVECIKSMNVRGAPAIGVTAGFGLALAAFHSKASSPKELLSELENAAKKLIKSRPTASNLFWAVDRILNRAKIDTSSVGKIKETAIKEALQIRQEDENICRMIGENGAKLIKDGYRILTHCNAGRLATSGDYGTALAPIYVAKRSGKDIFVWVDETRPRCQGARLTAWELGQEGVRHAIIADNAAGHFMKAGEVDLVIVGADRIAANGDVANKIGTYEKAVLAKENGIPFYVAAPLSTFDPNCPSGDSIPIEERGQDEVLFMFGQTENGPGRVRIAPEGSQARNPSFDVTPARYIEGLITPRGIVKPRESEIKGLFG